MDLYIGNEYDPLKAVLVHRPGNEIDRLNYHNVRTFLFEDIPYLKRMQEEHDEFTSRMRANGVTVVYLEELLQELFDNNPQARTAVVQTICSTEGCPELAETLLDGRLASAELVQVMFCGLTRREYKDLSGQSIGDADSIEEFVLPPIPNAYFSRDPAVVVKTALISCKMHYVERIRETVLTRAILEWHPGLNPKSLVYGGSDSPDEDRPYTVEGGDVLVLNPDALLIGDSERTTWQAVERIATNAFEFGHMKRMYEIKIPVHRDFMHLDTVFTVIDRGTVVWYPQVMEHVREIRRYEPLEQDDGVVATRVTESRSLEQVLRDEFDCDLTVIPTGGGHQHYGPREQRTDGTNVLAIAPRKVLMYDRNFKTQEALQRHGIETITLPGSELVRGLGGPRCMSMPLVRQSV